MHDAVLVLVGSDSDISCKTLMKLDSSTCICNKEAELVITHANSVHKFDDHMQMYHLSKPGELRMCKQFAPDAPSDFSSA